MQLPYVNFKLLNGSFVIGTLWLTPANFNIGCSLLRQGLEEPWCTTAAAALATTVAAFAIPKWVGGVPLSDSACYIIRRVASTLAYYIRTYILTVHVRIIL